MNAIYLHEKDGFTFLENVPEKPIKSFDAAHYVSAEHEYKDALHEYEHALAECIEKRMVIGNPDEVYALIGQGKMTRYMKEGELYPWPGTWDKKSMCGLMPGKEATGCSACHGGCLEEKVVVILSPPKEDIFTSNGFIENPCFENGKHTNVPVNSSMSYSEKMDIIKDSGLMAMPLSVTPGTKVQGMFINGKILNGYDSDKKHAEECIFPGREYTVKKIRIRDWSSTVEFEEFPGITFNTVHFATKTEPCAYEEECQHPACNCGSNIIPFKKPEPVVSQDQEEQGQLWKEARKLIDAWRIDELFKKFTITRNPYTK